MLDEDELLSDGSSAVLVGEIVGSLALSSFTFSPFGNDSIDDADKRKSGDRDARVGSAGVKPRTRGGATEQNATVAANIKTWRLRVSGIVLIVPI